jgi:hypothetical protein
MFQAQRHCYKRKYKLVSEQQIQYFYEALFLIFIQIIFCISIISADEENPDAIESFKKPSIAIQTNIFFSNMILHFSVLATIRNGIYMCKFVVFHPEEFDNPIEMFVFAFLVVFSNMLG